MLLILALVALPLRGMAAVTMWHCAQQHRDAMSVSADLHSGHHGTQEDASADHAAQHAHTAEDAAGGSSAPADPQVASTCSACAGCCTGGSIAPTAWTSFGFSFAPIGASRIPFIEQRFTGFVPPQLDRPPRVRFL